MVAAVETAQTQRPGTAQQRSRKEGLAGISLEEQNILFSLDRLNQRLHRVREHVGSDAGSCGLALIDAPCVSMNFVSDSLLQTGFYCSALLLFSDRGSESHKPSEASCIKQPLSVPEETLTLGTWSRVVVCPVRALQLSDWDHNHFIAQ
uniref:Uncharacterized protein n=1 Tax=Gasterosteus aculeatus TaxID=69293 RepID=G3PEP6_GASAC